MSKVQDVYEEAELQEMLESMSCGARVWCEFTRESIASQPATDKGLEMFCRYQLKLDGQELVDAMRRIKKEEIGEKESDEKDASKELKEIKVYSVDELRREPAKNGALGQVWLGDWQIKANLKAAASRLGYFQQKRGTKGDLAEAGRVRSCDASVGTSPERILVIGPDGKPFIQSLWTTIKSGNVGMDKRSIVKDCEYIPRGSSFCFEWLTLASTKLTREDAAHILALAGNLGIGGARSMEASKYKVRRVEFHNWGKKGKD